ITPVVRDHPRFGAALLLRAILYQEANQPQQAIPLLRQVLELDRSRQQMARYHLSLALAQTGQKEEAQRVQAEFTYRQTLELLAERGRGDDAGLQIRLAESLFGLGK